MSSLHDETYMDKTYDLEELRKVFPKILETQPEFINIQSTESQYNIANGIYKLFPYYQKLSPNQQLTSEDSRFIIHKHVISGQWQLTEVYDYFWTRNIKAFPVTEKNEIDALLNNLVKSHKIEKVVEAEVKSKNETIELFNNRNGWLKYQMEEKWREIATINKELEFQLIQKEKKICDLENKLVKSHEIEKLEAEVKSKNETIEMFKNQNGLLKYQIEQKRREIRTQPIINKELTLKLIQKEKKICDLENELKTTNFFFSAFSNTQNAKLIETENRTQRGNIIFGSNENHKELKSKLIEKENEICHLYKTQDQLKSKLIEKENEICHLYKNQNKNKSKLSKKEFKVHDIHKTQEELKSKLSEKENEIFHFNENQKKLESKEIGIKIN